MTLAIVNVLPDPVMPSSTWCRSCAGQTSSQLLDGLKLVPLGLVVRRQPEWGGHRNGQV